MKTAWSLRARLLAVSGVVLLCFIGLTGLALDRAFRDSADAAQQERLEALVYLLMGSLEISPDGHLLMPAQLPEARLSTPGSGLYAHIVATREQAVSPGGVVVDEGAPDPSDAKPRWESNWESSWESSRESRGQSRWQSNSTLGVDIPFAEALAPGERLSEVRQGVDGRAYRVVAQGVRWAIGERPSHITFGVSAALASRGAEVGAYRRSVWAALALMSGLLLLALVAVQGWGLRPLRLLTHRLAAMEAGETREIGGRYPRELAPLVANLDRLLTRERALMERHRKALADLAHALKTPLAVLRSAPADAALPALMREQTQRMDDIVHYQLQRAATAGASQTAPPLALAALVDRLHASMAKVYAARRLVLDNALAADVRARIDEGDALELLGNLIDNACKWARTRVQVHAQRRDGGLVIAVEDDGPGIADLQRLMLRGQRGDEGAPGHGIGLAVVHDIALAYGGELRIERSALGGARVVVWLGEC